ncbi:hypothetical protein RV14_GL002187 [Enterococcus ratti]|uniref:Uncharacterized protein n=1 Tax=Enterococcus ratti TaxID=150033 RepID=A0A1L8WP85_9ENTE|nr:hypothetical protein RV14_GL002187 [Enterococcus ratti]
MTKDKNSNNVVTKQILFFLFYLFKQLTTTDPPFLYLFTKILFYK